MRILDISSRGDSLQRARSTLTKDSGCSSTPALRLHTRPEMKGEIHPVSVKVGEKVLLPEYGGTKVVLDDKDYFLFRDADILGKYVE
uniref:10 kDa heat shock protein, mitochondrial n=1 Tax=Oreochromis aureus TaxID=47969 RepID=A0AAZ1XY53_OREAU